MYTPRKCYTILKTIMQAPDVPKYILFHVNSQKYVYILYHSVRVYYTKTDSYCDHVKKRYFVSHP